MPSVSLATVLPAMFLKTRAHSFRNLDWKHIDWQHAISELGNLGNLNLLDLHQNSLAGSWKFFVVSFPKSDNA